LDGQVESLVPNWAEPDAELWRCHAAVDKGDEVAVKTLNVENADVDKKISSAESHFHMLLSLVESKS
jgi:hypothetical protein